MSETTKKNKDAGPSPSLPRVMGEIREKAEEEEGEEEEDDGLIHQRTGQMEKEEGRGDERGLKIMGKRERGRENIEKREEMVEVHYRSRLLSHNAFRPDYQSHLMELNEAAAHLGNNNDHR